MISFQSQIKIRPNISLKKKMKDFIEQKKKPNNKWSVISF